MMIHKKEILTEIKQKFNSFLMRINKLMFEKRFIKVAQSTSLLVERHSLKMNKGKK